MKYKWKLNDNHYSMIDRLKIASFVLNPNNRWTSGEYVLQFENVWKEYTGYNYAIMTSSGSTAVELLALTLKNTTNIKNIVVPTLTWSTSILPWINLNIKPIFVDIDLKTLCMDVNDLQQKLKDLSIQDTYIFPTFTMGLRPNFYPLIKTLWNYPVYSDMCEASFALPEPFTHNIRASVTSFYFGHIFTTGTEGGMFFTNDKNEAQYAIQARNHGMVRDLSKYGFNNGPTGINVHPMYEFATSGSNWRSNDLSAYMGLLDFKRKNKKQYKRRYLSNIFYNLLSNDYLHYNNPYDTLFALPIISKTKNTHELHNICQSLQIESRPIISGNLLRHKAFQQYGDYKEFLNTEFVHQHGIYIGLHEGVTSKQVVKLATILNQ